MREWKNLLQIAETLLGPEGCPWDREQTLSTLQPYLLEETHELLEAIDLKDSLKIKEELGDVLYVLIFIAKVQQDFLLSEAVQSVAEKLVRRHPHVFGDKKISSSEEVLTKWEEIKKQEEKKNPVDGIPPAMPALARAQKMIQRLRRAKYLSSLESSSSTEEGIGERLWEIVREAESAGIDAESALRRATLRYEEKYRR